MEQSTLKRSIEEDVLGSQDEGDLLPTIKKAKLDDETSEHDNQEKEAPTISDEYNSDDADITLVSSDNVAFKVHSYQLMVASTVFRSMLSIPNTGPDPKRAPIGLSDPMLEHSWVLEPLLDIVYTMETGVLSDAPRTHLVLDLADKWKFAQARVLIHAAVSTRIFTGAGPWTYEQTLKLCIRLKDVKLAAACMTASRDEIWSVPYSTKPRPNLDLPFSKDSIQQNYDEVAPELTRFGPLRGSQVLDLGTWAYRSFLQIPPTIVWAMLRATNLATTKLATVDQRQVSVIFGELLTLAFETKGKEVAKEKE